LYLNAGDALQHKARDELGLELETLLSKINRELPKLFPDKQSTISFFRDAEVFLKTLL
jgi:hypothetical protein